MSQFLLQLLNVQIFQYHKVEKMEEKMPNDNYCLLYTSDAADERSSVDLGGRRIIKKKNRQKHMWKMIWNQSSTEVKITQWEA